VVITVAVPLPTPEQAAALVVEVVAVKVVAGWAIVVLIVAVQPLASVAVTV